MEYYYTPKENISSHSLSIKGDEAKHLSRVLRKKEGEEIFVTDGEYNLFKSEIRRTGKDFIECEIKEHILALNEPTIKISLYQSLLKNPSRFEFVIEKAVELGVYEIIPLITEHVINKNTSRVERWQSIALSAMKQSQRCYLPKIKSPVPFPGSVNSINKDKLNLLAHEHDSTGRKKISDLKSEFVNFSKVSIFIGPEGGFTDEEVNTAFNCGFKILDLGNRKLRSETAAVLSAGLVLSLEKNLQP
ncbi:MAG: 16S rRNA (uracil(1498)-N(3))-methyltransferase [Ignavibacteriae bacterium]|nr:MAG: 16S rRNA (uracil(1498)-N(3))-methyltransferase [Ignavibacteriota bacterium]